LNYSQFIDEVVEGWNTWLETLSLSNSFDDFVGLGSDLEWITAHELPMIEDALWEGSSGGGGSEDLGETEGLSDWEVSLHVDEWGSDNWLLRDDDTSSLGHGLVNGTDAVIWGLDLAEEDWLLEFWFGGELRSEHDSSGGWHDLTSTSVDGIGVEGDIVEVVSDTSHVLVAHSTFSGGPLEGRLHGVLDFGKELSSLGGIDKKVWSVGVWAEAPDLEGIGLVPVEFIDEASRSFLGFHLWSKFLGFNEIRELVTEWLGLDEKSVVLVWGFGEAHLGGFSSDGLLVSDDWVTLLNLALGVLLNKILKADLDVELTATGDNMLTTLFSDALDERIRLGELLQTLNKFWEIGGVLDINGNSYDWRDGEFHDSDVVGILGSGDGTLLENVLIDTNETDGVTAWNIWDGFDLTSHHDDGSLDVLDVEIVLGSWLVVWTHDSNLLTGGNDTGEDSTEGIESTLVVGGDHLGDEDHEWSVLLALLNGLTGGIVDWTFVEIGGSVLLGSDWTWELEDDHFKKGLGGVDPLLEDVLHEMLSGKLELIWLEVDLEGGEHLGDFLHLSVHGGSAESDDWLHHELDEGSLELLVLIGFRVVLPFLGFLIEVVITPKFLHHLGFLDTEFSGIDLGEFGNGESPSEKSGTESASTNDWVNLECLELFVRGLSILVGSNQDVDILDNSEELLIHGLTINLKFEDTSINLVNHENWDDLFTEGLSEDGLGLYGSTFDIVDDDKGTISDSEGSGDFSGEINVTWGVDEVDEETVSGFGLIEDIGLEVHGYTGGLDGNTSFLFILSGIGGSGVTSVFAGNDTGFGNEGISECRFTVIDVSNNRHVSDLRGPVLALSDLVN